MITYTTLDCPALITNTAVLLDTVLIALCDIDTELLSSRDCERLDQSIALLTLARDANNLIVAEVQRGPEYVKWADEKPTVKRLLRTRKKGGDE